MYIGIGGGVVCIVMLYVKNNAIKWEFVLMWWDALLLGYCNMYTAVTKIQLWCCLCVAKLVCSLLLDFICNIRCCKELQRSKHWNTSDFQLQWCSFIHTHNSTLIHWNEKKNFFLQVWKKVVKRQNNCSAWDFVIEGKTLSILIAKINSNAFPSFFDSTDNNQVDTDRRSEQSIMLSTTKRVLVSQFDSHSHK